jgi:hypothetical protein
MTLRSQLSDLATSFVDAVLEVIRSSSMDDLMAPTNEGAGHSPTRPSRHSGNGSAKVARTGDSGRLPRRSLEEIARQLHEIVSLVRKSKEGLRAEQIRDELGLQAKQLPRVLKEGLSTQMLRCKGNKRATTYLAT